MQRSFFTRSVTKAGFKRFGLYCTPICVREPHSGDVPHYGARFDLSFARHRVLWQYLYKRAPRPADPILDADADKS